MKNFAHLFLAGFILLLVATASAEVAITRDSKTDWRIVQPKDDAPQLQFAAHELQKYLQQMSSAQLPIAKKEKRQANLLISLREKLSPKDQALLPAAKAGYDGYTILMSEKPLRIIIAGENQVGCIYGVYDFLEKLGCRWFYPTEDKNDPEVVPKRTFISIKPGSWSMASPIQYRICNGSGWYFEMDPKEAIRQVEWAMKNRYNAIGWQADTKNPLAQQYRKLSDEGVLAELEKRGMFLHGPAHCFNLLLRHEDYMEQHPEWFGMRGGKRVPQSYQGAQFCWSNPEARKQMIVNAETFIRQAKLIKIFCPIPFDGGQSCECDNCKKIGASNLLMTIMAELIEKLKTSCPGVLVETVGGYGNVTDPPTNLEIIHPEQRIVWAHWGRHHGNGYDDPKYNRLDNLEKWRKAAKGGLTICQYYTDNFAEPWVMGPFAIAMESDRKYFLRNKIDSIYMLMYPRGYWWNHSLNGYLAGRCFYDTSINPFTEIKDYATNYFGPAAGPLLASYYTEWAKNIDLSYRVRGDSRKQDREMLVSQRKQWIDPAVQNAKNIKLSMYRVGKVEKLHTLAENMTEGHRLRNVIQILRQQGKFDEASVVLEKARIQTDKIMEMFYTLADLNQGLIEKKEVPGFIKMGVKNWIEEEAKAIAAKDRTLPPNPWRELNETEMLPADVLEK